MKYEWRDADIKAGRKFWGHDRASNVLCVIGYDGAIAKPDRFRLISPS